jgi:phosphohistidine phosphatase SixA
MKKLIVNFWLIPVFLIALVFSACDPRADESPTDFRITSPEFENGFLVIQRAAEGPTVFQIETNHPVEFSNRYNEDNFQVDPSGEITLTPPQTTNDIFWVEVIISDSEKKILPVVFANRPEQYKNVINSLVNFQNHNDELVLFFRHMIADVGADMEDSEVEDWWKSCESSDARQLSESGKNQAKLIGNTFKKLNIPVGEAISSEMCRAFQSLEYMELGMSIQKYGLINHASCNNLENIFPEVMDLVPDYMNPEEILLVAGHSNLLMGNPFEGQFSFFRMGDGFLLKKGNQGELELLGGVPFDIWRSILYSDFL